MNTFDLSEIMRGAAKKRNTMTTDHREVMQQALDAMENDIAAQKRFHAELKAGADTRPATEARAQARIAAEAAIAALRQALAEPVEPTQAKPETQHQAEPNGLMLALTRIAEFDQWDFSDRDAVRFMRLEAQQALDQASDHAAQPESAQQSAVAPAAGEGRTLLRRASRQLWAWTEKYGAWQPTWLPPAGDVRLQEDIDAYLQPPPAATKGATHDQS